MYIYIYIYMNSNNIKHKIKKYTKKNNFDVKFEDSEFTYQLLKHKYINNKILNGGTNEILFNFDKLFYVYMHGSLLLNDYVTIPKGVILLLPSCCGKYFYKPDVNSYSYEEIFKIFEKQNTKVDVSKYITIDDKIYFAYVEGETVCNLTLRVDLKMLSENFILNIDKEMNHIINNRLTYEHIKFNFKNLNEYLKKKKKFNEFKKLFFLETTSYEVYYYTKKCIENIQNIYEKIDYEMYKSITKYLYEEQIKKKFFYYIKFLFYNFFGNDFFGNEKFYDNDEILDYSLFFNKNYKKNISEEQFMSSIEINFFMAKEICIYALYICLYNFPIDEIIEKLKTLTLEKINTMTFFNLIVPFYFSENEYLINFYYDIQKFNLISNYINSNILILCTPPDIIKDAVDKTFYDIKIFIINNMSFVLYFLIYYICEYNESTNDFIDVLYKNIFIKETTIRDILNLKQISNEDEKKLIVVDTCQITDDNELCMLQKCVNMHTKNEKQVEDKFLKIKNHQKLLLNIYDNFPILSLFKNIKEFPEIWSYSEIIQKFFNLNENNNDKQKIDLFNYFYRYIDSKYDFIKESNIKGHNHTHILYMPLFSSHLIQIIYYACLRIQRFINNNFIIEPSDKNNDEFSDFLFKLCVERYITIDKKTQKKVINKFFLKQIDYTIAEINKFIEN